MTWAAAFGAFFVAYLFASIHEWGWAVFFLGVCGFNLYLGSVS